MREIATRLVDRRLGGEETGMVLDPSIGVAAEPLPNKSAPVGQVTSYSSPKSGDAVEINHEALDKLRMLVDRPEEFSRLIIEHIQNAGALLATIRSSLAAQNIEELRRAAHSLKSSAAMFGAPGVSKAAAELEAAVKVGDWPRMQIFAQTLDERCKQAHAALLNLR